MLTEINSLTNRQKYELTQGRLETLTDILILEGNSGNEVPRKIKLQSDTARKITYLRLESKESRSNHLAFAII